MRPLKAAFTEIATVLAVWLVFLPAVAADTPPAPELSFIDGAHARHTLADFKGHFVLLNVWATWCAPCIAEMPSLDKLRKDYASRNLLVVALSADSSTDIVKNFYEAQHLPGMPVYLDDTQQSFKALHIKNIPTTLLLNTEGVEIARFHGSTDWGSAGMHALLNEMMEKFKPTETSRPGPKVISF